MPILRPRDLQRKIAALYRRPAADRQLLARALLCLVLARAAPMVLSLERVRKLLHRIARATSLEDAISA
ncbi:MAG: hypothetical protein MI919_01075, partial [Holophagales bacterium]|nr:hypothetical protein [Holophagales bacterium]